jgi:PST family polysaccharide transporter
LSKPKTTYSQIFKSTVLFGGVQIFNILISIIRTKLIAVLIGPFGMGISGLLQTTLNLHSSFSSLGLENSGIKNISQNISDTNKTSKSIAILKRLVWIIGIIGALLFLTLSSLLSKLTFGNYSYTTSFAWVSIALFFKQLSVGEMVVLQGMRKLKSLAIVNLLGSSIGLIISVPLYYYLKLQAIVPTIVISSVIFFVFSFYFAKKVKVEKVTILKDDFYSESKELLSFGLMLSLGSLLTLLTSYLLQIYISKYGSLTEVGLYNAGFTLLNSYVGIVFSSMATDYFPRLSAVNSDSNAIQKIVSEQALIAVLIITPIIVLFEVFTPTVVKLLFSDQFTAIVPMIALGILGMLFRAASWSVGYIILAKGDSKVFVKNALFFNGLFFILHCFGYSFFGMKGLGMAFMVYYFCHYIVLKFLVKNRYQFKFNVEFYKVFSISIVLCGLAYLLNYLPTNIFKYTLFAVVIVVSVMYSLIEINKKLNLKELMNKFVSKFRKDKN